jgi:hypothetical protein
MTWAAIGGTVFAIVVMVIAGHARDLTALCVGTLVVGATIVAYALGDVAYAVVLGASGIVHLRSVVPVRTGFGLPTHRPWQRLPSVALRYDRTATILVACSIFFATTVVVLLFIQ